MQKTYILLAIALGLAVTTLNAEDAKANYAAKCATCHGKDGKPTPIGLKLGARDYSDAKVLATIKDEDAIKAIKEGIKKGDKVSMRPFGEKLTEAEIKEVVAYVRSLGK